LHAIAREEYTVSHCTCSDKKDEGWEVFSSNSGSKIATGNMSKHVELCRTMSKYVELCRTMIELCRNMSKYMFCHVLCQELPQLPGQNCCGCPAIIASPGEAAGQVPCRDSHAMPCLEVWWSMESMPWATTRCGDWRPFKVRGRNVKDLPDLPDLHFNKDQKSLLGPNTWEYKYSLCRFAYAQLCTAVTVTACGACGACGGSWLLLQAAGAICVATAAAEVGVSECRSQTRRETRPVLWLSAQVSQDTSNPLVTKFSTNYDF
jgi:hypothetical protein